MVEATHLRELERTALTVIRAAFPIAEPPSSAEMQNDHCPECREVSAVFVGKRWDAITASDLAGNLSVCLLPAPGLRYYLPALMLRCVEAPEQLDCVPDSVIATLSPPNNKPDAQLASLLASVNQAQVAAVLAFLRVFEARYKIDRFPPEAFEYVPASKVMVRAIAFWTERLSTAR